MIALFTIPKPFRGHVAVIQRNAIQSWLQLKPACEIILFGDEEGTAEIAGEMAVRHVPEIKRNEYGTPLVNDIFYKALVHLWSMTSFIKRNLWQTQEFCAM
jgi:hypothetical protein